MKEVVYAGDDYQVSPNGLRPYNQDLEFLPWQHVDGSQALVVPPLPSVKQAFVHPPGTALHENKGLQGEVDDYYQGYGTSVQEVSDNLEHHVRNADQWMANYGSGWYKNEPGHAVERLRRLGYSRHEASHLIADLSPQNPWIGTVNHPELGNREEAVRYGRECKDLRHGTGKYTDHIVHVTDDDANRAQGAWGASSTIRPGRYDISHEDPRQWDIKPEQLSELPQFHSRATRVIRKNAISTGLGLRHVDDLGPKTGPFQDNIMKPFNSELVTNDTWQVSASGLSIPRDKRQSFLMNKGGSRTPVPVYKGFGHVGLASATTAATHRLNAKRPKALLGHQPLNPLDTQAIIWNQYQEQNNPKFKRLTDVLREKQPSQIWGYNFDQPHA